MALDVQKQVAYWRNGAVEALQGAELLIAGGRYSFGLFFLHLAVEKAIKSLVAAKAGDLPPKIHDLSRLAERAALALSPERASELARFTLYNLSGRYEQAVATPPDRAFAETELATARELVQWLLAK
jgi:HEPN domain-containing protein